MPSNSSTRSKRVRRLLGRSLLSLFALPILYLVLVLLIGTFNDWQPKEKIDLVADQKSESTIIDDSTLTALIWNIGYTGLGEESNFFYDSPSGFYHSRGKMIRTPKDLVEKNLKGVTKLVDEIEADFYLMQEVDIKAKRSYYINAYQKLQDLKPGFAAYFSANYKNGRVPIPVFQPFSAYGEVHSGLATLSRYASQESTRLQLPGEFGWPNRVFSLDRCISLHRYPTNRDKDLVVINVHLSAYDADGALKKQQMVYLRDLAIAEYEAGNYVLIGGDWNQCPPDFQYDTFSPGETQGYSQYNISDDYYPEGWQWVYDATIPTNRKMHEVYQPGETFTTVIDFFLLSPNLKSLDVKTYDQAFKYSDHQPIWMELELL